MSILCGIAACRKRNHRRKPRRFDRIQSYQRLPKISHRFSNDEIRTLLFSPADLLLIHRSCNFRGLLLIFRIVNPCIAYISRKKGIPFRGSFFSKP